MKINNNITSLKRGRPPKKDYDPEVLMRELIDTAAEIYQEKKEIKATALELSLPSGKVKKLWSRDQYEFFLIELLFLFFVNSPSAILQSTCFDDKMK